MAYHGHFEPTTNINEQPSVHLRFHLGDAVTAMGCAGAKANAISTAVAQKVRAQRERSRQFARGPKSHLDSQMKSASTRAKRCNSNL